MIYLESVGNLLVELSWLESVGDFCLVGLSAGFGVWVQPGAWAWLGGWVWLEGLAHLFVQG